MEKICPLIFLAKSHEFYAFCRKEDCEWYIKNSDEKGRCALVTLANNFEQSGDFSNQRA
jgi:hypothetical protein